MNIPNWCDWVVRRCFVSDVFVFSANLDLIPRGCIKWVMENNNIGVNVEMKNLIQCEWLRLNDKINYKQADIYHFGDPK